MKLIKSASILLLAFSFSCTSSELVIQPDAIQVSYKPAQCSEPWDEQKYFSSNAAADMRENRFLAFLKEKNISNVLEFKNVQDKAIYCSACTCPSNDNFSFKVSLGDYEKLKALAPFKGVLK